MLRKRVLRLLAAMMLFGGGAQAANLVANGDFESGLAGWADTLWRYQGERSVAGMVSLDSANPHDGVRALKVVVTKVDSSASNNWHLRLYVPSFQAIKGYTYTLTFWARSETASSFYVGIDTTAAHSYGGAASGTTSTSWRQYKTQVVATQTGADAVFFNVYLSRVGTFYFDGFDIEEEAPAVLSDKMRLPTQGAWYTGGYRNLFAERGYDSAAVRQHLQAAYEQLFFSSDTSQSVFRLAQDTTMGFIDASGYVLTEGQSYGMIISVMMNRQDVFNKLWKFAKTYQQHSTDSLHLRGLFRWKLKNEFPYGYDSASYGNTPAPDGEEYFATALFLAAKRWGSGSDWFDYQTQADSVLIYMRQARTGGVIPEIDSAAKQTLFSVTMGTATRFTDASYHLPAFYRMWAAFTKNSDSAFYRQMADTSLAFLKRHMDDSTGLCTNYAGLEGLPYQAGVGGTGSFNGVSFKNDTIYGPDSHRTSMNIAVDWAWFQSDEWEVSQTRKELGFFYGKGGATTYKQLYSRKGAELTSYTAAQSQIGANGAAVLASDTARDWAFIDALYALQVPSGAYRYYNGLVYLLGYLHASGNFKAYGSPGLPVVSSGIAGMHRVANSLSVISHGRRLAVSGALGARIHLLDAAGRIIASAPSHDGRAELTAPGRGLWILESAKAMRTVLVP